MIHVGLKLPWSTRILDLKQYIRDISDFPQPGILFKDITPLVSHPGAFRHVIETFSSLYKAFDAEVVVGIEARGFVIAAPLAFNLDSQFVLVRKEGKLPLETTKMKYSLEYGESALEVHTDAINPGQRVLIVDDLIATGGTMAAAARLVETLGGEVAALMAVIEIVDLKGRDRLRGYQVFSQVQY